MKVQIPDALKEDMPQSAWGKILTATPVVMAVVSTMLAGLASSEMTRAQYDRSLAAQQQSKAGDQWSFFQAKRLRGAFEQTTFELLQNAGDIHAVNGAALKAATEQLASQLASAAPAEQAEQQKLKTDILTLLDSPQGQQALSFLGRNQPPEPPPAVTPPPQVQAALEAMDSSKSESEIAPIIAQVRDQEIEEALRQGKERATAFDAATKPANATIDHLEALLAQQAALLRDQASAGATTGANRSPGFSLSRDFTAARLHYTALRYEVEARLNQAIANLYELQVRKSNHSAERHHTRSQRFFYGMLGAQLGVIISTFAIAARKRNFLWSLAAVAGLLAIAFAIYVYLYD
ncbi:conserved membrane hypothetical protein [Verrucomicrobia bacterium]|nr:conserved membrane hypothetical protein [Verrucomicrobiota bacterium]